MIRSFLKTVFRNLIRRKGYSAMNVAGLAIGMTCCLLIFEYVAYERSYEDFNKKADRIFRVQDEEYQNGRLVVPCAAASPGVAPAMLREFPEVEKAGRLRKVEFLLGNDAKNIRFKEPTVYYCDQSILDILNVQLVKGNAQSALSDAGKVVISEEEERKYFGDEDAVGKVLTVHSNGNERPLEVTGVFKDYPGNSHLKLSVLVSYPTYSHVIGSYGNPNDVLETAFAWTDFYTYILLRHETDRKQVAARLPAFMDNHYNNLPENKSSGDRYTLSLMPLKDIHLSSHYTEEAEANGDGQAVNFLFLTAFFIIGIAWINYINLATARSLERAREVGVRKVLGANKGELIRQFMLESLLLNLIALTIAVIATLAINPLFASLSGRDLPRLISLPTFYAECLLALLAAGTFCSGFYPALVLARYRPVVVLKGLVRNTAGGQWLRKGLIIGQFAASIVLIASTLIVYRQLHYMQNQNLGADINETVVIKGAFGGLTDSSYHDAYAAFKHEVLKVNGVKSMTASSAAMGEEILWSTNWNRVGNGNNQAINLFHLGVDEEFISSYGLKMLAGEPFSRPSETEQRKIIINESAVRALGFSSPQAALGEYISGGQNSMDSMKIKGVISDYHNEGLQKSIQPLVLFLNRNTRNDYSVKIEGINVESTIGAIKKVWAQYFPTDPFDYFFLDDFFSHQYDENRRFGKVFSIFAILAIVIACFGLLGLSAYNVLQRTKEIGVRKVLGATVNNLLFLLSKDFVMLVLIAFAIAAPIAFVAMSSWLQGFAYRTNLPWWIFAGAGIIAIFIAVVTVGLQALKATLANPVKSLRNE